MKSLLKILSLLAVLTFFFAPCLVRAQDYSDDQGVSFQTFYDQLGNEGTWVQTDDYGYVFQPNVQDPNWAPYTDGHWVYTTEGWAWVSEEPWGWATYHYGRWANIDDLGWVWVPGYRWAPAWVSWRYGGGYAGWAPLPPETFVGAEYGAPDDGVSVGFHFGNDVDVNFHIGAGCYNFVRVGDMGERNYRGHFVNRENNYTVINQTTNVTNITVNYYSGTKANFQGVATGGPEVARVNARSRQQVQTVQLTAAPQPGPSTVQGNSLAVFAPRINPAITQQTRPAAISQTRNHPTFNRGDSITKPMAVTASVKPVAPSAVAIQAATVAQAQAPATAKIATEKTPIKKTFSQPLTSLAPVAPPSKATAPATTTLNPNLAPQAAAPIPGGPMTPAATQPNEAKPGGTALSPQAQHQQDKAAKAQQKRAATQPQAPPQQPDVVPAPKAVTGTSALNPNVAPQTVPPPSGGPMTPAATQPNEVKPSNAALPPQAQQHRDKAAQAQQQQAAAQVQAQQQQEKTAQAQQQQAAAQVQAQQQQEKAAQAQQQQAAAQAHTQQQQEKAAQAQRQQAAAQAHAQKQAATQAQQQPAPEAQSKPPGETPGAAADAKHRQKNPNDPNPPVQ